MKKITLLFAFGVTLITFIIADNIRVVAKNNSTTPIKIANSFLPAAALVAPVATAGSGATYTQITANWNSSVDATHYHLDVSTSIGFANFITGFNNLDVGNVTSYNVIGLTDGTTYYYRVRAENVCNTSGNSNIITYNTILFTCGSALTINHIAGNVAPINKTVNYSTVLTSLSGESKCWISQNLGSSNQATSASDGSDASAGWYWQFNRKQGYKVGPTPTWSITSISENSDWIPANDPCTIELGSAWRIPSYTEWFNADANGEVGGWSNYNETYADVLKLHAAGVLYDNNGGLVNRSVYGGFWSSNQNDDTTGRTLYLESGGCAFDSYPKAYGRSLRCIKD
ncbi:MAG: hypothetical protein HGB12_16775 [Bacteroidetes bacterium]|nr:hypothetical protein [Bacteroidota bacterium]